MTALLKTYLLCGWLNAHSWMTLFGLRATPSGGLEGFRSGRRCVRCGVDT